MRAIFISYRRDDAEGQAGRLFGDLCKHFGDDALFMDVAAIEPGRDFRRAIDEHVASCGVLLCIIGRNWISAKDEGGKRRLDDTLDFVRLETASALKRDIPVVPVLVHGAKMPRADDLPDDLKELAYRNGVELTHSRWDSDLQILVKALRPYVQPGAPVTTPLDIAARPGAKTPPAPPAPDPEPELKKKPSRMKIGAAVLGAVLVLAVAGVAFNRHSPPADSSLHASAETSTAPAAVTAPPPADVGNVANVANVANAAKTAASGPGTVGNTSADAPGVPASDTAPFSLAGQIIAEQGPWKLADFPPPNGGKAWFRVTSSGDPACVSYDGRACLWGMAFNDIDQTRVKELVCGEAHKKIWGATGYEDPKHWCSIVRNSEGKF